MGREEGGRRVDRVQVKGLAEGAEIKTRSWR
jgi:hypothetical protein